MLLFSKIFQNFALKMARRVGARVAHARPPLWSPLVRATLTLGCPGEGQFVFGGRAKQVI